jgi:alkylation response protein AidB-like acyl-CoA dehydrogenase
MDFEDSPDDAAYRRGVRSWIASNAPSRPKVRGAPVASPEELGDARAWQAAKAGAGYAQIHWPTAWGGGGGTVIQQLIFAHEELQAGLAFGFFKIGLGMCMPTIMEFGAEATKERFIGPAVRGDEIWCQLFSEPGCGSDLAGVRTRATRCADGSGDWLISGQKVWTSFAQFADFGIALVRTDPEAPKHRGLTMFWIDMRAPGVEVRPIHQMSGASEFNEVFLTDVRVSDSQRLGAVNAGWDVAVVTLANERTIEFLEGVDFGDVIATASQLSAGAESILEDRAFRERLADAFVQQQGLRFTYYRAVTTLARGGVPGPEYSIGKIVKANLIQDLSNVMIEAQDRFGIINDAELAPAGAAFQTSLLWAPALRIAGGTDEILRNIIAERVLGLPPEPRVDKTLPFNQLPSGRASGAAA